MGVVGEFQCIVIQNGSTIVATPHVNPLYCLFNVQSFIWIFRMCIVHHHHDRLHDHHQDNYYQDNHRNAYLNPKPLPGWLPSPCHHWNLDSGRQNFPIRWLSSSSSSSSASSSLLPVIILIDRRFQI